MSYDPAGSGSATSHPPASPELAEAIAVAAESLEYHDRRMGKRLRKLKGEPAFAQDEENTGVVHVPDSSWRNRPDRSDPMVMADPFPTPGPVRRRA